MNILLVEDDQHLGGSLRKGLSEEGHSVQWIRDGGEAREFVTQPSFDLIILDIMLPGLTGIQLCEMIRYKGLQVPVLMLSALGDTDDKITALDIGADDYMVKPFHFRELLSRINALYRRAKNPLRSSNHEVLECGNLTVDKTSNKITRNDRTIQLSSKEFKLLCCLLEQKDRVVTRTSILETVWGTNQDVYTNVIDVYISYLRNKIDVEGEEKLIHTIKGRGYMISDNA